MPVLSFREATVPHHNPQEERSDTKAGLDGVHKKFSVLG